MCQEHLRDLREVQLQTSGGGMAGIERALDTAGLLSSNSRSGVELELLRHLLHTQARASVRMRLTTTALTSRDDLPR